MVRLGLSDEGGERGEFRGQVDVAGNGTVELPLRTLPLLPKVFRWNQVQSVWLDGFLGLPLEIGPVLFGCESDRRFRTRFSVMLGHSVGATIVS